MYFYKNSEKGYFVLQDAHGEYYENVLFFTCNYPSFGWTIHDFKVSQLSKAKQYKRTQDLLGSIRNLVRNKGTDTFYDSKHENFVDVREYEYETQYWLGNSRQIVPQLALQNLDFTILNNITVLKRNTETKTVTPLDHDFEHFMKHAFYRCRSNHYFSPALTSLLLKTPNFISEDPSKFVYLAFNDKEHQANHNPYAYFFDKKVTKDVFKNCGFKKKDMTVEIIDGVMAILVHDSKIIPALEHLLGTLSTVEYEKHTVKDILTQNEIDLNALWYTEP